MIFHSSKTYILFCFLLLFCSVTNAQNTKGLNIADYHPDKFSGKTYALVVGISKYKDPGIHALEYADKDAEAFYQYLKAENVDSANMVLLLNEKATSAQFWSSLLYLVELSKQGDKVLVYFSGHGDVETKTAIPEGYLLPYDVPRAGYMPFAIPITVLKNYVSGMSVKGVQIIFIIDACHSGNLAGGLAGIEAAANLLKNKWKDEIKMLSCQPKELSLEGKQWGGGRGLFSYELINGLAGKADKNKDGKVTLRELNLYLMEKVPEGASPQTQNPELEGNPEYVISKVNEKLLLEINKDKSSDKIEAIAMRGDESSLLNGLSADIKENFKLFKTSLDSEKYVDYPEKEIDEYYLGKSTDGMTLEPSALFYFKKIPESESTKYLISYMKRCLCAAIMESLTASALDMPDLSISSTDKTPIKIKKWINTIADNPDENNYRRILEQLSRVGQLNAITLQHLITEKRMIELGFYSKYVLALFNTYSIVPPDSKGLESLKKIIEKAIEADTKDSRLLFVMAVISYWEHNPQRAIEYSHKALTLSPKLDEGNLEIAKVFYALRIFDSSKYYSQKVIEYTSSNGKLAFEAKCIYFISLGSIELDSQKNSQVSDSLKSFCNSLDTCLHINDWGEKGYYYQCIYMSKHLNRIKLYEQSLSWLNKFDDNKAKDASLVNYKYIYKSIAYYYIHQELKTYENLKIAFDKGYNNYKELLQFHDLDPIRRTPEYLALMKKYFPDQYKN